MPSLLGNPGIIDYYRLLQVDPSAQSGVIRAAYRVLIRQVHPDVNQSDDANRATVALNRAYKVLVDPDSRRSYDAQRATALSRTPASPEVPRPSSSGAGVLNFGRYQGWALKEVARRDPDYLRWLGRHSSGLRHRAEIERLLCERNGGRYQSARG